MLMFLGGDASVCSVTCASVVAFSQSEKPPLCHRFHLEFKKSSELQPIRSFLEPEGVTLDFQDEERGRRDGG